MILARARSLQLSRTGALPEMCHRGGQVGTLQIWTGTVRVKGLWIKAGLISTQADAGTGSVRNGDKKAGPFTGEAPVWLLTNEERVWLIRTAGWRRE